MVAVVAGLRRQVERNGKAGLPLGEIFAIERIRIARVRMPRIGAENPGLVALPNRAGQWLAHGAPRGLALCAAAYSSGIRKGSHAFRAWLPSGDRKCPKLRSGAQCLPCETCLRSFVLLASGAALVRCALSLDEADDDQKYDGTNHRINDRADEAGERHESQLREQPDADESADNSDDDVPDQSETKTAHDLPGQPACDRADDNHDDNAVYSNHDILPWPGPRPAPTSSAT